MISPNARENSLTPGPDGWSFAAEGAAVHQAERLAVVADLHLGYEWVRGQVGDQLPAHSLNETLARLERLFARARIDRLVIAGDLVESPRPCARTSADLMAFRKWLESRGVQWLALPGNHDPRPKRDAPRILVVNGWTIAHGHEPIDAPRTITGHDHPAFRSEGVSSRCVLSGPRSIILPAFSENAAGLNVGNAQLPAQWIGKELRCLVATENELLDFGEIETLNVRLTKRSPLSIAPAPKRSPTSTRSRSAKSR